MVRLLIGLKAGGWLTGLTVSPKLALTLAPLVSVTVSAPGFIPIDRKWKEGDTITLNLDMRGRLYQSGGNREYFAIARGLKRVEAGAQGEHKLLRGYLPVETYSAHLIAHKGLARAVDDFLEAEREAVTENIADLARHAPFRKNRPD